MIGEAVRRSNHCATSPSLLFIPSFPVACDVHGATLSPIVHVTALRDIVVIITIIKTKYTLLYKTLTKYKNICANVSCLLLSTCDMWSPVNTKHCSNVVLMLMQRLQRFPSSKPLLVQCIIILLFIKHKLLLYVHITTLCLYNVSLGVSKAYISIISLGLTS